MGKINNTTSYPFATPVDDDYVIGTDVSTSDLQTKNFRLGDIAGLDPVDTLQAVLNAGNTANAPALGIGTSSIILQNNGVTELQLNPPGGGGVGTGSIIMAGDLDTSNIILSGNITDSTGSQGLTGYVLKSLGAGLGTQWLPDGQPNLAATKFWYGNALNQPVESNSITNDESGTGLLSLGQIGGGLTRIDNNFIADITMPVGDANLQYGLQALNSIAIGDFNTGLGISSLNNLTNGNDNCAIGYRSQGSHSSGNQNVSVGNRTLGNINMLDGNTAVGHAALSIIDGDLNTAVGGGALSNLSNLSKGSVAIGYAAGENLVSDGYSVMIGVGAKRGPQISADTIAIGRDSMNTNSGDYSIAIGNSAAQNNVGGQNIAIGWQSLTSPNTDQSIAIGSQSMAGGSSQCIAIGVDTLNQPSGEQNIAIGYRTLSSPGVGNAVIAIGTDAFTGITNIGDENIGIGFRVRMAAPGGFTRSIGIGAATTISRDREFVICPDILHVNLGSAMAAQVAAGTHVYANNNDATTAGLIPGDIYVIGPTGAIPAPGSPAPLAIVF